MDTKNDPQTEVRTLPRQKKIKTTTPTRSQQKKKLSVMFDTSKKELFTNKTGYRKCFRKVKSMGHSVAENADTICKELLSEVSTLVLAAPRADFKDEELNALEEYLENGGNILVLGHEGGLKCNLGKLLSKYGITVNSDVLLRTVYYKFLHPKEVLITSGVKSKIFLKHVEKIKEQKKGKKKRHFENEDDDEESNQDVKFPFVYPYGATLDTKQPALPLLHSGFISYPMKRPIVAFANAKSGDGKICVVGSSTMFSDKWLNKQNNAIVLDILMKWFENKEEFPSNFYADERETKEADAEISERRELPHTGTLAERIRPCLEETETLPKDFTKLFKHDMFRFDTNMIPEACKLYEQLEVKDEALSLIPPQFECPLPKLEPAVFPPTLQEPPPPALDQFDLDEQFASERARLAQVTNKCAENDLRYFIRECGEVLNITPHLKEGERTEKHVLEHVLRKLVQFKKLDQGVVASSTNNSNNDRDLYNKSTQREVMLRHYANNSSSHHDDKSGGDNKWKVSEDRLVLREGK